MESTMKKRFILKFMFDYGTDCPFWVIYDAENPDENGYNTDYDLEELSFLTEDLIDECKKLSEIYSNGYMNPNVRKDFLNRSKEAYKKMLSLLPPDIDLLNWADRGYDY